MATDYGKDTSCLSSLRTGRLSTGRQLLAEAAFRRITTKRGTLRGGEHERNYGIDVTELIGASNPKMLAAKLPALVQTELLKDERFLTVKATSLLIADGPAVSIEIGIEIGTADGPFNLKIGVDEVSARLLGIEAQS